MKIEYEQNVLEKIDEALKTANDQGKVISLVKLSDSEWTNLYQLSRTPDLEIFGGSAIYRGLRLQLEER
jgi:hypothetical protein